MPYVLAVTAAVEAAIVSEAVAASAVSSTTEAAASSLAENDTATAAAVTAVPKEALLLPLCLEEPLDLRLWLIA